MNQNNKCSHFSHNPLIIESLILGNKFIKWDDDSTFVVPVNLFVDLNGYILYWKDQNREMDCIDIMQIRDTRTGIYARLPKDPKLKETLMMGSPEVPLSDKMLTICLGNELTNLTFMNFAAISKEIAQEWTSELFKYSTFTRSIHYHPMQSLERCYARLYYIRDSDGKIPIKNFMKVFGQSKEDIRKIQNALELCGLPSTMNEKLKDFTLNEFCQFYQFLTTRNEIASIFFNIVSESGQPYMTTEQFMQFLNDTQRDSRLNELLHPLCTMETALLLARKYEPNFSLARDGNLSRDGFLRYLLSYENSIVPRQKMKLTEDMTQPLAHYFINSSHNSYLSGHQLTSKSSVEMYRQALLIGCRCLELDCWDGKGVDEEPVITHGFTICSEIIFKDVLEAIAETAFKTSDYPVILSFENHCSQKQQAKIAHHCKTILKEYLLTEPLENCKLEENVPLPSPEALKRKILIKNKKHHEKAPTIDVDVISPKIQKQASTTSCQADKFEPLNMNMDESESDSDSELEKNATGALSPETLQVLKSAKADKGTAGKESSAAMEMSNLAIYFQPAKFHSFEQAEKKKRSYECFSFVESQATTLLKAFPIEFVNHNKMGISRIYPKGTRVDSSNYIPQIFWNAGCQLVALNFQTLDLAMQLNLGIFEYNDRCGYILKPDFMRRHNRNFDPFTETTVDGIVAATLTIKVLSGQFISDRRVNSYVEIDMFGLPADTYRHKFRTKVCPNNGINPLYGDEEFVFKRIILPQLASLRIAVFNENGTTMYGHRVLPVENIRPGYRHILLRNESNQPQGYATLFVHISIKDYILDSHAVIAAALSNPIAYQSQREIILKHTNQLAILEEDNTNQLGHGYIGSVRKSIDFEQQLFVRPNYSSPRKQCKSGEGLQRKVTEGHRLHKTLDAPRPLTFSASESNLLALDYCSATPPPQMDGTLTLRSDKSAYFKTISDEIAVLSLTSLKLDKRHMKIVSKLNKEFVSMRKKHNKELSTMFQYHQNEINRRMQEIKYGIFEGGDCHLAIETAKQQQSSDLVKLCYEQGEMELKLRLYIESQIHESLLRVVDTSREDYLGRLDQMHNKLIASIKKKKVPTATLR